MLGTHCAMKTHHICIGKLWPHWMDRWFGFYGPFNIIDHTEPGCQWREMSDMGETPLWTQFQTKSRLEPCTIGSQVQGVNHWTTLVMKKCCWTCTSDIHENSSLIMKNPSITKFEKWVYLVFILIIFEIMTNNVTGKDGFNVLLEHFIVLQIYDIVSL